MQTDDQIHQAKNSGMGCVPKKSSRIAMKKKNYASLLTKPNARGHVVWYIGNLDSVI